MISNILLNKGLCLHASSVEIKKRALLFLGHSTAGKSTISHILSERYPIIADDKVLIFMKKNRELMVQGISNKYCEKNPSILHLYSKMYPLLAAIRIFKSENLQINPISQKQLCRYIVVAVFEIDFQRFNEDLEKKKELFSTTERDNIRVTDDVCEGLF